MSQKLFEQQRSAKITHARHLSPGTCWEKLNLCSFSPTSKEYSNREKRNTRNNQINNKVTDAKPTRTDDSNGIRMISPRPLTH